jgi:putative mRNA 3-end processing factor
MKMNLNKKSKLISFTDKGLYCRQADVYIDPWKPVKKALLTHGHADHARPGSNHYLSTDEAAPVIRYRLGNHINLQTVPYNKKIIINGVEISFHPAGHIIGSAQISIAYKGEIWVISGDYKLEDDGISTPYEPLKCHHFITESTFGLPAFKWRPQIEIFEEINTWWNTNREQNSTSIISAYSLGKAQRLIQNIDHSIGPVYCHDAIQNVNDIIRTQGIPLKQTSSIHTSTISDMKGSLIIAPPSAMNGKWIKQFKKVSTASASGWMAIRGTRRRSAVDRGFVLSDHVDWESLNQAVKNSQAENIYVTHGYTDIYSRYLLSQGYNAKIVLTEFSGESFETSQENDSI